MALNPLAGSAPASALAGVTGSVKVQLLGGAVITGTLATSTPTDLANGIVKVTDSTPTTWVIQLVNVVAVGQ